MNNAGILRWERMADTSFESWNEVVAVNQTGVFLGMRAVAPQMKEQHSGSIVNISSVGGLSGASACFAYAATKWAVRGMTKGAAIELGPHGIKVNSIHPGIIDTPMMGGTDLDELAAVDRCAPAALRAAGGGRQARAVAGVRRQLVLHRSRVRHRRGPDRVTSCP